MERAHNSTGNHNKLRNTYTIPPTINKNY